MQKYFVVVVIVTVVVVVVYLPEEPDTQCKYFWHVHHTLVQQHATDNFLCHICCR